MKRAFEQVSFNVKHIHILDLFFARIHILDLKQHALEFRQVKIGFEQVK